jgi:hypothetical protein
MLCVEQRKRSIAEQVSILRGDLSLLRTGPSSFRNSRFVQQLIQLGMIKRWSGCDSHAYRSQWLASAQDKRHVSARMQGAAAPDFAPLNSAPMKAFNH